MSYGCFFLETHLLFVEIETFAKFEKQGVGFLLISRIVLWFVHLTFFLKKIIPDCEAGDYC